MVFFCGEKSHCCNESGNWFRVNWNAAEFTDETNITFEDPRYHQGAKDRWWHELECIDEPLR
jgi:hypothetical protein